MWKFYVEILCGNFMWKFYVEILCGNFMWKFYVEILCGNFMWKFYVEILCGNYVPHIKFPLHGSKMSFCAVSLKIPHAHMQPFQKLSLIPKLPSRMNARSRSQTQS